MKCQCPKPDYFWNPEPHGPIAIKVRPTDLHFKKADRECVRCGMPLCFECSEMVFADDDYGKVNHKEYCRACYMEER